MTDFHRATLAAYQRAVAKYVQQSSAERSPTYERFLDTVVSVVVGSTASAEPTMLELGSGPGLDAEFFEQRGFSVLRTDATPAFLDRLRAQGHRAELLDLLLDEFDGSYDLVFANAVLLHLPPEKLATVLPRIRAAIHGGGTFAFTVKEGDGEAWSTHKLNLPRYFAYWREPALREMLAATGWKVLSLDHVRGRADDWLYVICRPQSAGQAVVRAESRGD